MEKNIFNNGILYCLQNSNCWGELKKCGLTTQCMNRRLSGLHTSLPYDCNILITSDELIDVNFYEHVLKKFLSGFRHRNDREFFDVNENDIKQIFNFINLMNRMYNTTDLLEEYMKTNYTNYYKQRNNNHIKKVCGYIRKKKEQRKQLFVKT